MIQYIGIILISRAGETGRFICLSQCPRTSGGRSQRSGECEISMPLQRCRACLCCRSDLKASALVGPVFVASLSDEKGKVFLFSFLWRMWRTNTTTEVI